MTRPSSEAGGDGRGIGKVGFHTKKRIFMRAKKASVRFFFFGGGGVHMFS